MNNKYYTVCGIVEINKKILMVRHTYGTAKDRILIPGGYVNEGEMPTAAIEREVVEETGIVSKAKSVMSIQFKPEQWCVIFVMEYVSGKPKSDGYENSEVLLLYAEDAIKRQDITNMSREILTVYCNQNYSELKRSEYVPESSNPDNYAVFGI